MLPQLPHRLVFLILALSPHLAAIGAGQTPNTLNDAEKRAGWKLLFDGRTDAQLQQEATLALQKLGIQATP